MVEIDHRLRRELCGQTHIAALTESVLCLFQQFIALRAERVEIKFGVRIRPGEVDRMFRTLEMIAVAAIQQFALGMGEEEERRRVRFDIAQRHDVKIDVGNLPAAVGHFVTQDAFGLNPIVFRSFTNDHQQIISRCVAMRRAADQFTEKQDIFGIEIAVRQAVDDPGGFGGVVEHFRRLFRLRFWFWDELPGRLFRRGYGSLFGVGVFGGYGLCRLFLHGVLIRFHVVKYYRFDNSMAVLIVRRAQQRE